MDDLGRRESLIGLRALGREPAARDGDGEVQLVELRRLKLDGLLRAPAEAVRPGGEAQHDRVLAAVGLRHDFELLLGARRIEGVRRRLVLSSQGFRRTPIDDFDLTLKPLTGFPSL